MKTQSLRLIATALILSLSAIYISANPLSDSFRIEIPFEFQVGGKTYEAGTYRFKRKDQTKLVFENAETGRQRYLLGVLGTRISGDYNEIKLTFHRYGDRNFLRKVTSPGSTFSLRKSKSEKKVSKSKRYKQIILGP